jgi:hypothetical protein
MVWWHGEWNGFTRNTLNYKRNNLYASQTIISCESQKIPILISKMHLHQQEMLIKVFVVHKMQYWTMAGITGANINGDSSNNELPNA